MRYLRLRRISQRWGWETWRPDPIRAVGPSGPRTRLEDQGIILTSRHLLIFYYFVQRFKESAISDTAPSKEQVVASELNRDITGFLARPHKESSHSSGDTSNGHHSRPKYTSNFAPSSEDRSRPVKTPPGPPPGAYDLQPKWLKSSAVVMAPSTVISKKIHDTTPG